MGIQYAVFQILRRQEKSNGGENGSKIFPMLQTQDMKKIME